MAIIERIKRALGIVPEPDEEEHMVLFDIPTDDAAYEEMLRRARELYDELDRLGADPEAHPSASED